MRREKTLHITVGCIIAICTAIVVVLYKLMKATYQTEYISEYDIDNRIVPTWLNDEGEPDIYEPDI